MKSSRSSWSLSTPGRFSGLPRRVSGQPFDGWFAGRQASPLFSSSFLSPFQRARSFAFRPCALVRNIATNVVIVLCLLCSAAPLIAQETKPPAKNPPSTATKTGDPDKSDKPGDSDKPDAAAEKARKNAAFKAMKQVIENAEFDGLAFEDFVEWLSRTTKVNVVVR